MKYICKVLTTEFKSKADAFIISEVNAALEEKGIAPNHERRSYLARFKEMEFRGYLNTLWNGGYKDLPEVLEYYKSMGMTEPEFTEIILDKAEVGLQSRARVIWNGEVVKIDEIDEIFSYKTVD